eukprot:TRINITY_DN67227_c8_g1_i1.p1 TRINITY_DN67227_c8_g1~~TRINITY_DN67227_c8_g1_i1.p1  ORF type:complete len:567 (-),score=46.25 TRINITY_DN67227_c8_g1_i1:1113-2681(-)
MPPLGIENPEPSDPEPDSEPEEPCDLFTEQSELLAQALVREFLHRKKHGTTFQAYQVEVPVNKEKELSKRTELVSGLHLEEDFQRVQDEKAKTGAPAPSVLELLITNHLRAGTHVKVKKRATVKTPPASSGGGGGGGGALQGRNKKNKNEEMQIAPNGESAVFAGKYVLGQGRVMQEGEIAPPKALAELRLGRLISDLGDLDRANQKKLGAGASGAVYKVLHKPTGNYVALKEIRVDQAESRQQVYKELLALYTKANEAATPSRRHIVRFHGAFFHEGMVILALECMGGSLDEVVCKNSRFPGKKIEKEEVLRAIAFQVLHALHYLHKERHMIHRDIKPANILYNAEGEVKVSDFGVASEELLKTVANAKTFVGTTIYMSPERLKGQNYTNKADVWAFGLVLYILGTGEQPWKGLQFFEVLAKVQEEQLTMPRRFSDNCRSFVEACLQRDPDERYQTSELLEHPWMQNMTDPKAERIVQEWVAAHQVQDPPPAEANTAQQGGGGDMQSKFQILDELIDLGQT